MCNISRLDGDANYKDLVNVEKCFKKEIFVKCRFYVPTYVIITGKLVLNCDV